MATYHGIIFGLVRSVFAMVGAFSVLWTMVGVADLAIGLEWGYSWPILIAGPALAIGAYGYRFITYIEKVVLGIRG